MIGGKGAREWDKAEEGGGSGKTKKVGVGEGMAPMPSLPLPSSYPPSLRVSPFRSISDSLP